MADLLADYKAERLEAALADLAQPEFAELDASFGRMFERWERTYGRRGYPPDLEDAYYLLYRLERDRFKRRQRRLALGVPEHALRVRSMSMSSPWDLLAYIPTAYAAGQGLLLFLRAIEERFNMRGRIQTERVELEAERAERRADQAEAEVREERARGELQGLQAANTRLQLVRGELLPAEDEPPESPGGE